MKLDQIYDVDALNRFYDAQSPALERSAINIGMTNEQLNKALEKAKQENNEALIYEIEQILSARCQ